MATGVLLSEIPLHMTLFSDLSHKSGRLPYFSEDVTATLYIEGLFKRILMGVLGRLDLLLD